MRQRTWCVAECDPNLTHEWHTTHPPQKCTTHTRGPHAAHPHWPVFPRRCHFHFQEPLRNEIERARRLRDDLRRFNAVMRRGLNHRRCNVHRMRDNVGTPSGQTDTASPTTSTSTRRSVTATSCARRCRRAQTWTRQPCTCQLFPSR
jgi:hypothetical protein